MIVPRYEFFRDTVIRADRVGAVQRYSKYLPGGYRDVTRVLVDGTWVELGGAPSYDKVVERLFGVKRPTA